MTRDLADYYARRAAEYDTIYARPERQADIAALGALCARLLAGRDVLEIACGTGFWTAFLARSAASVRVTDIGDEVLALARARLQAAPHVTFERADAFDLNSVQGTFGAAFAGFWWSHVRRAERGRFLDSLHRKLGTQARVVVTDNRYVEGNSTPISRTDAEGNTYQRRRLRDGSEREILKNFTGETEFRSAVETAATCIGYQSFTYFWCGWYDLS